MIALARGLILTLLPATLPATLTAAALAAQAPWWLTLGLGIPTLMLIPGLGWARWLAARQAARTASGDTPDRIPTALQLGLDAAWISMAWAWLAVALVREMGLRQDAEAAGLLVLSAAFALVGRWLARGQRPASPPIPGERLGSAAVIVAVLLSALWRHGDIVRPLDGYWWMAGADEEGHPALPIVAGEGFTAVTPLGWPESGALKLDLPPGDTPVHATLVASGAAKGRLILAVRGPIASWIHVSGRETRVARSIQEAGEDKPVRRYLDRGTAGIALDIDLRAGETLPVQLSGDSLYVLPGTDAVWAAHASGDLRFTHYWQILNQVENLDWAAEVLDWRWFTLHQPPAWSPLLATTLLLGDGDLPSGNLLFLWVIGLVGLSAVRLSALLVHRSPRVPAAAWLVPAGLVGVHALLMFEPGSTNFPDSLYAAAVVAVAGALASRRTGWFVALGLAAGLLRWPGIVVATILALCWWAVSREAQWRKLGLLWTAVSGLAVLAAVIALTGGLDDMLFILYFETFPEHWHGHYQISELVTRIPEFYWIWLRYSGGGLLMAALCIVGPNRPARQGLRFLLASLLLYSLLLCTIDHHPTHYFLPLLALTGPAVIAASAATLSMWMKWVITLFTMAGLWTTLWIGQVF